MLVHPRFKLAAAAVHPIVCNAADSLFLESFSVEKTWSTLLQRSLSLVQANWAISRTLSPARPSSVASSLHWMAQLQSISISNGDKASLLGSSGTSFMEALDTIKMQHISDKWVDSKWYIHIVSTLPTITHYMGVEIHTLWLIHVYYMHCEWSLRLVWLGYMQRV